VRRLVRVNAETLGIFWKYDGAIRVRNVTQSIQATETLDQGPRPTGLSHQQVKVEIGAYFQGLRGHDYQMS